MSADMLSLPAEPRRSPRAQLLAAHERRAAIRALASRAADAAECALLLEALDLDPADGLADLPPVTALPVLPPPPVVEDVPDHRPPGLRHLAPVGPISPPKTPGVARRPAARSPRTAPAAPPADGLCPTEGCGRPYRHRGVHAAPRPTEQAPADGLCTADGCDRPWKHRGVHTHPRTATPPRPASAAAPARPARVRGRAPAPLDAAEVARRYQDGERLFDLAADLHVGAARIRQALAEQGVRIRGRGEVVGQRGPAARPIDEDECVRLYTGGMDTHQVARQLQVKQTRVREVLRARGVLKRQPGTTVPFDPAEARRLYATGMNLAQVSAALGVRTGRVADVLRAAGELRPRGRQAGR